VVVLGVLGGVCLAAFGRGSTRAGAGEDITAAVRDLAVRRTLAFTTTSTAPLAGVDEPGSPAMAADTALVRRLAARGLHLDGLSFTVSTVRVVTRGPGELCVEAAVTTSAHRQVRPDGSLVARVPASPVRVVRLVLVRAPGGGGPQRWLVRRVI